MVFQMTKLAIEWAKKKLKVYHFYVYALPFRLSLIILFMQSL